MLLAFPTYCPFLKKINSSETLLEPEDTSNGGKALFFQIANLY
jgi:hypothetical protein